MRKIPSTMATQHPDNAGHPYWSNRAFISTSLEIKECFLCFSDLGLDEYNWDWEGKFVDEAVIDRLLHKHLHYFKKHPLGKDKFLTFRLPNPRVEKQFRLARAFMVVITSSQLAQSLGFNNPPIFETILPLTETPEEILEIQKAYRQIIRIDHRLLAMDNSLEAIEIIPLFEQVGKIIYSASILRQYIRLHRQEFGKKPDYLRPYCARSDPALNSGLVPTMLALKIALSRYKKLEETENIRLYPMVGTGSLPFRGGVTPLNVDQVLKEYRGIKTLIIQSAFRYDYPVSNVKEAIDKFHNKLHQTEALRLSEDIVSKLEICIPFFEKQYKSTVEAISGLINQISLQVEKRRERLQHIGLFGYSRGLGKVHLPRAIPFTASLYSLGIPPEFIGTGRGLKEAKKRGYLDEIIRVYKNIKEDLITAGRYLNKDNLNLLSRRNSVWQGVVEDIKALEDTYKCEFTPSTSEEREHYKLTGQVYQKLTNGGKIKELITESGILRKSLG